MLLKTQHVSREFFLAQVAESDQRFRGIMIAREVMSLAPLGREGVVWTIGVTKGAIQGGARARKSRSFRC